MDNFLIPPDYALIIKALNEGRTLRGAASLLHIDPSSLVRKMQRIHAEFGLVEKVGNRWVITEKGQRLGQWAQESISRQRQLLHEKTAIRIASFSWMAEEMLLPQFTALKAVTSNSFTWSFKIISTDLEQELITGRSDFVITGHAPNDPTVAYKRLKSYPWRVIFPAKWGNAVTKLSEVDAINYLRSKPYIRLSGLAPEQTLTFNPETFAELTIDGVIGLRTAVAGGLGWSCVPAMSVKTLLMKREIICIDLPVYTKDDFSLWWLRSRKDIEQLSRIVLKWMSTFQVSE